MPGSRMPASCAATGPAPFGDAPRRHGCDRRPEPTRGFTYSSASWIGSRLYLAAAAEYRAALRIPRLRLRARRTRPGRSCERASGARDRARTACGGDHSAAAVRRPRSAISSAQPVTGAAASGQYALIGVIERLLRANGVRTDLEMALFDADHGIAPAAALALAGRAHASARRSTATTSSPGRSSGTATAPRRLRYSRLALRLGTRDALKFFHRGMIERCLGSGRAHAAGSGARSCSTRTSPSCGHR